MYQNSNKGDTVCWSIGEQKVRGQVVDTYKHQVRNTDNAYHINDSPAQIRNALLIELDDGRKVLKLENEVRRVW